MSESGSSIKPPPAGEEDSTGTEVIIVEGFAKFRDVKRWKQRYCVLTKLSPAAGREMNWWLLYISVVMVVVVFPQSSVGYRVMVDAYSEECFFERVDVGNKLGLTFEVIDGGFLDIDLRMTDPDGEEVISRERESNGKVAFTANKQGIYIYCFGNQMSTMTPKEVMFSVDVGDSRNPPVIQYGNYTSEETALIQPEKLQPMINELRSSIRAVKLEQEYMEVRDKIHGRINESTNSRVLLWSCFESIMILALASIQVFYIKRFFEVRRIV